MNWPNESAWVDLLKRGVVLRKELIKHQGRGKKVIHGELTSEFMRRFNGWCDELMISTLRDLPKTIAHPKAADGVER
jgi:hypothetical protein